MILVVLIVLLAALVQGVMGFGGALIAMPLLAALLGIKTAVPAFALIGVAATFFNSVRLRRHATAGDLIQLALPALLGIPLGVWLLARVDEVIVTRVLGVLLVAYAIYALWGLALPPLRHRAWAFVVGFTSGILTGAYNTGGPPVVARDATGAGDSLAAAIMYGYLHRFDLQALGDLGNATGAAKVLKLGTGHNMPTVAEVNTMLRRFGSEVILEEKPAAAPA